jgi:hypothetical protein
VVGVQQSRATDLSFSCMPLIRRSFYFFPFWFFVDHAAMRANCKTPFEPPAQRTGAVMFPDACFTSGNSPGLTRTGHPKKMIMKRP